MGFVGRRAELAELDALLDDVRRGRHADRGVVAVLRGRRRVGKSRLVAEFAEHCGAPVRYLSPADLERPWDELLGSPAVGARDHPQVVVVDDPTSTLAERPALLDALRALWDGHLAARPVLLVVVADDTAPLDALTQPVHPWRGRSHTLTLDVMSPREVGDILGLAGFDAFDAYLVTGGLPLTVQEWVPGSTRDEFLRQSLSRSTSALVVAGLRRLDASLPTTSYARAVLGAIGGRGERTFTGILNAVADGTMSRNSLTATLEALASTGLIAADDPLSTRPAAKDRRWRVADPALAFWLAFVEPALQDVDRARVDPAMERVAGSFAQWRNRAVQPIVRDALARLLPTSPWPGARRVGGWWSRGSAPELPLVAADDSPAGRISFVGTVAWRRIGELTVPEIDTLVETAARVPGVDAETAHVAVCPGGSATDARIARTWTADDLLAAWA